MESYSNENESQYFDQAGTGQLLSASRWARFVGIVYCVFAVIIVSITLFLLLKFDRIASELIALNGMSDEMMEALSTYGKSAIATILIISAGILSIIGIFLFRFGSDAGRFTLTGQNDALQSSLGSLKNYLLISFVLGILSTVVSIISTLAFFSITQ